MKTMCFNLLYKIYFNNKNVLKRIHTSYFKEFKCDDISVKQCLNSRIVFDNKQCDVQDIKYNKLKVFKKLRETMTATGKYNIDTSLKKCKHELADLELIKNIKLESWCQFSNSECVEKFIILSSYAMQNCQELSSDDYNHVISTLTSNLVKFSDDELLTLLKCLELWPNISETRTLNVRNLLQKIDNELTERSKLWSHKKILIYCDIICTLCNFYSHFVAISLKKLISKCSDLGSTDIVHIMCFLFIYSLPKVKVSQLEPCIQNYFHLFEISELQIICLGFFGSQVEITNKILLQNILKKVISNVNDFSDNDLSAFLKLIRYSFVSKPVFLQLYKQLFECLISIVPRVNTLVLTQISHLIAKSLIYNPALISAIIKRFPECLETARIKDIERVTFLLTTFNYPPHEPLYGIIIDELGKSRRREEKKNFPKEYGFTLRHLMQVNIYPLDLISYVMGPEYKKLAYGNDSLKIGIENFVLDQSLKIECPYYKGQQLNNNLCKYMLNKYNDTQCDYTFGNKAKQQIIKFLNEMYQIQNVAFLYRILPHFTQTNIILCLDHNNNAIRALPILENVNNDIKWIPIEFKEKYYWIAFIFATETVIIRNTKQFSGYLCANIRQLKRVGYMPIVIPHFEWSTICDNEKKKEYIKKKISSCINLKGKLR